MRPSISSDQLAVLQCAADRAARRLRRQLRLSDHDLDDLRQDLLLDLIGRFPAFDPDRAPIEAFAYMVAGRRINRIAPRIDRERLLHGNDPVSLDQPLPGDDDTVIGDLVREEQSLGALFGQTFGFEDRVLTSTSLDAGLSELEESDRHLCAALVKSTIDQLAASGHGARATLYRRLKDIRMALLAYGVEPA